MKTSTLPALRVAPELRAEAEAVLAPGETLSAFVHDAVSRSIEFRKAQQEFVSRGLESGDKARRTGRYVSSQASLNALKRQLARATPVREE